MIQNLKALVVVLALALLVFRLAKPICLHFMTAQDYERRRNVWLVITTLGFISPSFWLYAVFAAPILLWATNADRNPGALFLLLLYSLPPASFQIPIAGINQLFDLGPHRLLALAVLLPAALRSRPSNSPASRGTFDAIYALLLAYMLLTTVLFMPYESFTNTLRRAFLFALDTVLIYHVFRRTEPTRAAVAEPLVMLALASALMAPVAVFESLRGWLLYTGIGHLWGDVNEFAWLMRGDTLRAQVSTGHALTLGYVLAMGFGISLYAAKRSPTRSTGWWMAAWIWAGLLAALSRGPWLTAFVAMAVFFALGPRALSTSLKAFVALAALGVVTYLSPFGDEVLAYLPFVGTVDSQNVTYRQEIFNTAVVLVQQRPFFGNPFVLNQMEHLRQGQGIIDLMNAYVVQALFYGLIGLALCVGCYLLAMWRAGGAWLIAKKCADVELCLLGACLIACMVATLFFAATAAFGSLIYVFTGLLAVYAQLVPQRAASVGYGAAADANRARYGWANG